MHHYQVMREIRNKRRRAKARSKLISKVTNVGLFLLVSTAALLWANAYGLMLAGQ